jgi:hypothetical protein
VFEFVAFLSFERIRVTLLRVAFLTSYELFGGF